jgi:hypothetical protein
MMTFAMLNAAMGTATAILNAIMVNVLNACLAITLV